MKCAQGRAQSALVKYDSYSIHIKLYNFCCLYKRKKSNQTTEENLISKLISIAFPGSKLTFSKQFIW